MKSIGYITYWENLCTGDLFCAQVPCRVIQDANMFNELEAIHKLGARVYLKVVKHLPAMSQFKLLLHLIQDGYIGISCTVIAYKY